MSTHPRKYDRLWLIFGGLALVTGFGVFVLGATSSPIFHPALRAEAAFVERYLAENAPDMGRQSALAMAYWRRYPEVRGHAVFGEAGLGVQGARAHYERIGQFNGYVWGLNEESEKPTLAEP